jgi:HD-GYP domain-containing protein (c-di-GMP phosphodiesterase class II)
MLNVKLPASPQLATLDAASLADFFGLITEAHTQMEQSLLLLQIDNADNQSLSELAMAIDNIHNALADHSLIELRELTSSLLQLIYSVRQRHMPFSTTVGDIILLATLDIKTVIEKLLEGDASSALMHRMPRICVAIKNVAHVDRSMQEGMMRDILLQLDMNTEVLDSTSTAAESLRKLFSSADPDEDELVSFGVELNDDFTFFHGLGEPLESRSRYWQGRNQRMLRLALKMNDQAGRPVDPNQLAAAVYMHDVGMALLPLEIINNQSPLTESDLQQVREHPKFGFELLRYMKQWREAAYIVLQHHERMDGSGYPYGLKENEICEGAKILAIVDAVDARTHERTHVSTQQQALLRAAMEIGKNSETQFSTYWVNIFKSLFQQMRKQTVENA